MGIVLNDLYDYGPKIYQDDSKFKFSLDTLLLSEYVDIKKSDRKLLDLCSGNAPLPLILASRNDIEITGIEIQKDIYDLAIKSIKYNGLDDKIKMLNMNVKESVSVLESNFFDIITCNPPFFKFSETSLINESPEKAIARHELTITFSEIIEIVSKLLKDNGKFYFVHRPERLEEFITLCNEKRLTVKEISFIYSKEDEYAKMILVKCVKNANIGMKVQSKVVSRNIKTYQNIFKNIK